MDVEIRRMTENKQSLDDVMRLLYNRYYKELKRGYTEEEFWNTCKEVAGQPLDLMRRYVDTTDEIDYAKCLQYKASCGRIAFVNSKRYIKGGATHAKY